MDEEKKFSNYRGKFHCAIIFHVSLLWLSNEICAISSCFIEIELFMSFNAVFNLNNKLSEKLVFFKTTVLIWAIMKIN